MERGETEGFCGIGWTFLKLRKGDWLRDKKVNILFQMSLNEAPRDSRTFRPSSTTRKTPEDRKVFEFLFAPQEMGRPFFAPPGVPADRLAALRRAFELTLKDPAVPRPMPTRWASRCSTSAATAIQTLLETHLRLAQGRHRPRQGGGGIACLRPVAHRAR